MALKLGRNAFIGLAIIASIFITAIASFAETINYSYDNAGRLTKAEYGGGTVVEYTYDKAGNRLQKVTTSTSATTSKVKLNGKRNSTGNRQRRGLNMER